MLWLGGIHRGKDGKGGEKREGSGEGVVGFGTVSQTGGG